MRFPTLIALALCPAFLIAQTPAPSTATSADPLAPLDFLLGTWSANTNAPAGAAHAQATGTYTFRRDLNGHALVRSTSANTCKGPATFDCAHHDQLIIFADPNGQALHKSNLFGLYLDSEGHVIYYTVSTPDAHTVLFNSQGPPSQPKFRLTYHLEGTGPGAIMSGKFQSAAPGSEDFHSYLEWTGAKQ